MKNYINKFILAVCLSGMGIGMTGCLEESFPENSEQAAYQIKDADKASISIAISAYFTT